MPKLYTHVQFAGFKIDTFPIKNHTYVADATHPSWLGWTIWNEHSLYLGLMDHAKDIESRIAIMKLAVEKAAAKIKDNTTPSTLKVFMSPEFFFRGYTGAYPDMEMVHAIREQLESMVNATKYEDWLFVFGSVIAKADLGGGKAEAYNIVYVIPGAGKGETRVVMKELKSGIDFLKGMGYLNKQGNYINQPSFNYTDKVIDEHVKHLHSGAKGEGRERQSGAYGADSGGGIFDYENVTIGVEICLDHLVKRLKQSPPKAGEWKIQLQLIPSAGMKIKPPSVIATRSGFAFNVDGGTPHVKLKQVKSAYRTGVDAELTTIEPLATIPITQLPINYGNLYRKGPPEVVVYAKLPLPHRVKA
jgi:predicted amidohydrolase